MKPTIRNLVRRIFPNYRRYWSVYYLFRRYKETYFYTTGWTKSVWKVQPVDKDGREIPWMCFPVVRFLEARLSNNLRIFEFGSGYSTVFYARLAQYVTSVEHDEEWLKFLSDRMPENVTLIYRKKDTGEEYCQSVKSSGQKYDVIIVDGIDRVNCMKQGLDALTHMGVMVLDDSQREIYLEGIDYVKSKGFRALDFEGLAPCDPFGKRATILYRNDNCLNI